MQGMGRLQHWKAYKLAKVKLDNPSNANDDHNIIAGVFNATLGKQLI